MAKKLNFNFKSILYWLGAISIALLVKYFIVGTVFRSNTEYHYKKKTIDSVQYLINFADSLNKKCPVYIDSITTLLNAQSYGSKTLKFSYSLDIDTSKYDLVQLKDNINKYLLNLLKTNSDFQFMKDWNIIVVYNYFTPKGGLLFNLEYQPEKYK